MAYVVDQINQRNQGHLADADADPMSAITKTLNMQLTSLKWAEQKADVVRDRITDLQQRRMRLVQLQSNA